MDPISIRIAAKSLAILWAGWWSFFAIASSLTPVTPPHIPWVALAVSFVLVGTAVAAWMWEDVGAVLLIVEGSLMAYLLATGFFNTRSVSLLVFLLATTAAPPIAAGILLLVSRGPVHGPSHA